MIYNKERGRKKERERGRRNRKELKREREFSRKST